MDVTFTMTVHVRTCPECRLGKRASALDYLRADWTWVGGGVGEADLHLYCRHKAWPEAQEQRRSSAPVTARAHGVDTRTETA
jgi:hypothetical protein